LFLANAVALLAEAGRPKKGEAFAAGTEPAIAACARRFARQRRL